MKKWLSLILLCLCISIYANTPYNNVQDKYGSGSYTISDTNTYAGVERQQAAQKIGDKLDQKMYTVGGLTILPSKASKQSKVDIYVHLAFKILLIAILAYLVHIIYTNKNKTLSFVNTVFALAGVGLAAFMLLFWGVTFALLHWSYWLMLGSLIAILIGSSLFNPRNNLYLMIRSTALAVCINTVGYLVIKLILQILYD